MPNYNHNPLYAAISTRMRREDPDVILEDNSSLATGALHQNVIILHKGVIAYSGAVESFFDEHNIIEYVPEGHDLTIADYYNLQSLASQYKIQYSNPFNNITTTAVTNTYPREIINALKNVGAYISSPAAGLYYIEGGFKYKSKFQIVVPYLLPDGTYPELKLIYSRARKDDIRLFYDETKYIQEIEKDVRAVFSASRQANPELYDQVRKEMLDKIRTAEQLIAIYD